ncbi:Rieske 2Fe-2S domain-containing protein [Yinghuangia seranimata]|uniref:Rieske 2Fe-2S domain-containing protein n=1 Tax=Yinghuangia seranimata TaxID=408067 RepID=UPI00248B1C8D|nr:Rieske 2Fe-2S domain-containing protein [Yinghuangia seranimata]MDI2126741.1 MBL fold metallo-hydrolase [Yinghuangia seranimata]
MTGRSLPPGARIRALGHAGYEVAHAGVRLLIDPWFHPAFLGAWFPFPDNRALLQGVTTARYDLLYLSHEHEDHFDERVLAQLDSDNITVVIPDYRSRSMVKRLHALGFRNLVQLGHKERYEAADGFVLTMLLDTSHKEDSGLIVDLGDFRFLDLNDCNTPLSELPGDVDLLSAQFSGAMWYPNCYAYPDEVQRRKTAEVRGDLFDTLVRKVRLTGASTYLPAAGPPCFLDPELDRFNDRSSTIFPVWDDVAEDFAAACPGVATVCLEPGDTLGELGVFPPNTPDRGRWRTEPEAYLAAYRDRREAEWQAYHDEPFEPVGAVELDAYFSKLISFNKRFLADYQRDVRLVADGTTWAVRLGRVGGALEEDPVDAGYTIHVPPRALRAIVDGKIGWEEALLSLRLSLHRDPDVFDLTLMSLLRYGNHPAQTMQMVRERAEAASGETIERCGYAFQRFCPHAGEDLALADIDGEGVLECPRHHWKWDLATGECVSGGTVPLRVEPAGRTDPSEPVR